MISCYSPNRLPHFTLAGLNPLMAFKCSSDEIQKATCGQKQPCLKKKKKRPVTQVNLAKLTKFPRNPSLEWFEVRADYKRNLHAMLKAELKQLLGSEGHYRASGTKLMGRHSTAP